MKEKTKVVRGDSDNSWKYRESGNGAKQQVRLLVRKCNFEVFVLYFSLLPYIYLLIVAKNSKVSGWTLD